MSRGARLRLGGAIAVAGLLLGAPPAAADPAEPTDYRSTVDTVTPATSAIEVAMIGSDSFVQLRVEPGHAATVLGYEGEPYLRVLADGTTQVNRRSPAVALNGTRYGASQVDPATDADAPPDWAPVPPHERAGESTLMWHDHRTHWMGGDIAPEWRTQEWHLALVVDGVDVEVAGTLHRHEPPSRWWWTPGLLALVLLAVPGLGGIAAATAAVSAGLLLATAIDRWSLPGPARSSYTPLVLLAVALVASSLALARRRWWSAPLVAGAGVALGLTAWMLRASTTHRFVPGPTPDRVVAALVVVAGLAGAIATVRGVLSSALGDVRRPPPDDGNSRAPADDLSVSARASTAGATTGRGPS